MSLEGSLWCEISKGIFFRPRPTSPAPAYFGKFRQTGVLSHPPGKFRFQTLFFQICIAALSGQHFICFLVRLTRRQCFSVPIFWCRKSMFSKFIKNITFETKFIKLISNIRWTAQTSAQKDGNFEFSKKLGCALRHFFCFAPQQCLGSISTPWRSKNQICGGISTKFRGATF